MEESQIELARDAAVAGEHDNITFHKDSPGAVGALAFGEVIGRNPDHQH